MRILFVCRKSAILLRVRSSPRKQGAAHSQHSSTCMRPCGIFVIKNIFVFRRWTKVLKVWNNTRKSNEIDNSHFWELNFLKCQSFADMSCSTMSYWNELVNCILLFPSFWYHITSMGCVFTISFCFTVCQTYRKCVFPEYTTSFRMFYYQMSHFTFINEDVQFVYFFTQTCLLFQAAFYASQVLVFNKPQKPQSSPWISCALLNVWANAVSHCHWVSMPSCIF